MKLPSIRFGSGILTVALAAGFAFAPVSRAQYSPGSMPQQQPYPGPSGQTPTAQPEAPKVDALEEAAYKAFYQEQDPAKKIQLGQDFVQRYPASRYSEAAYNQLVNSYYSKQDWDNFYAVADKALASFPDDVDVLTIAGWVIPHSYNPDDPDAAKKLDKAEKYEKHAIQVLSAMPKPANLTDEQFASTKAEKLSEAHSGLGIVGFRRQQFDESVKELQQATQGVPNPDPTDLYVLGMGLQQLRRSSEAADAFQKCAQIQGPLQDRCRQSAEQARQAK